MKHIIMYLAILAMTFANDCFDAKSCFEIGNKAAFAGDYMLAHKFYKKSCEMGHQGACESMKTYEGQKIY